MAKFIGKFRDIQNGENSGCYKAVSFDLINFDFNIKVYEPLWMYVLSMNLVVQSTHYPLHCDSLATVLINNVVSFVSEFLSCHFLVSVKWLFCGTEIRYIRIYPPRIMWQGVACVMSQQSGPKEIWKVSDVLHIDTFWWFLEGHWVSRLGLKPP